jgi:quercetin dioxygenase-like cupin family protein
MTSATHYQVQKSRRARFIDEWRKVRRTGVVKDADVTLHQTPRGMRTGAYMGVEGGAPTRTMDALVHEIDAGRTTSLHRHSWDVTVFVVSGSGWIEIDGDRFDYRPWDALHIPAWAWHRSGNDGSKTVRLMTYSSQPLMESLGMALVEEGDGSAPGHRTTGRGGGQDPYSRRVDRLTQLDADRASARLHTRYEDIELRATPRGTRTAFLVDESIGYKTSGLTQVMIQFAPGLAQTMHRHPGEAWLYVVEGHGHSYIDHELTGGAAYEWGPGDLIIVDHYLWHQHFNDDRNNTARLVRVHMFASLLETMRALTDPLVLFEEDPESLAGAPDVSKFDWPPDRRPT